LPSAGSSEKQIDETSDSPGHQARRHPVVAL
jgi:hypothetical protein